MGRGAGTGGKKVRKRIEAVRRVQRREKVRQRVQRGSIKDVEEEVKDLEEVSECRELRPMFYEFKITIWMIIIR